jgi:hypothetical protein
VGRSEIGLPPRPGQAGYGFHMVGMMDKTTYLERVANNKINACLTTARVVALVALRLGVCHNWRLDTPA